MGIKPIKSLSQHFLIDDIISDQIVDSMDIQAGEHILEIGPGEGVLTDRIMNTPAARLTAVELDRRLSMFLRVRHESDSRFTLIEDDFLNVDLNDLAAGNKMRIIGNLPYSITSPILFRLLDCREIISDITVMVQKEVADRLTSMPNCKAYGIPSVLFQLLAKVEHICDVAPNAFRPPPKVHSAVIRISILDTPKAHVQDFEEFRTLVRTAFGQRRKMLRNSIRAWLPENENIELPVALTRRPESLSVLEWAQLSNTLCK
ncbi:16S rRNA (adenine(1518)-N(6)/adenine(1519)-N(6))-dimethyltransferase RsmA [bacterium]|nr:16S rRNA (adenine(1518)-N(6)/adenine(1519)-N(6))-dimethyltransferase RsmA [bacterium]